VPPILLRRVRDWILTAVGCALAAFASHAFTMPGTNVSLVWLVSGVAVTALWLGGTWLWTAVAAASLLSAAVEGNAAFNVVRVVVANTVAPLVAVVFLRRSGFAATLARFRDALALLGAAALSGLAGAVLNGLLRLLDRGVRGDEFSRALNWFLGDCTGLLVIVPVALTWQARSRSAAEARGREGVIVGLLLALAAGLTVVAFPRGPAMLVSVLYLAVPVQMWAAARFGPRGGAQAFGVVAGGVLLASAATLRVEGVDPSASLVLLDGFLIVSGAACLVVAALVAENAGAAAALAEARRLDTVRRLSGGLAHDFNNLLTVILANVELLRTARSTQEVTRDIEEIRQATARAANITQALLAYGQQMLLRPSLFDVNELLREAEAPAPEPGGTGVIRRLELAEGLPPVRTDRDQLRRVISQLCSRAAVAMARGGSLTIATAAATIQRGGLTSPGILIRIEDTGDPVTPRGSMGVAEPYSGQLLTGTASERSSGLELAMADGFVRQVGGTMTVETPTGGGTRVTLVLPAASAA
jgi:signal transduction histidine kinase